MECLTGRLVWSPKLHLLVHPATKVEMSQQRSTADDLGPANVDGRRGPEHINRLALRAVPDFEPECIVNAQYIIGRDLY